MREFAAIGSRSTVTRRSFVAWAVLFAFTAAFAGAAPAKEVRVTLLQTTDMHGRVLPWDYFRTRDADVGLARVATYVDEVRSTQKNVILVDGGDMIQGTPLSWFFQRKDRSKPNPVILALNAMGYDALTVGNHEYNYGLDVLLKCRSEAKFPFLSANTRKQGSPEPFFTPYVVKEFGGVRIGVLGLTTSNIPNWESPGNFGDLVFDPTPEAAAKWVKILREKEKVDAVVINTHEGFEADLETGKVSQGDLENHAWQIATEIQGVDVITTGHTHQNIPPRLIGKVLVSQAQNWGQQVTRIDLVFRREAGHWVLAEKSGQNVAMTAAIPPQARITALVEPYHKTVLEWVDSPIGTAGADFDAEGVFTSDNAVLDLVHNMMREFTGAQLSFNSYLPGHYIRIPKGPIRVADLFALYPFENTPTVIAIKGKYIKEALERCAEIYDGLSWNAAANTIEIKQKPNYRRYGFNTLAGADYALDPSRPEGQRVLYLEIGGKPIDPDSEYTLATNNYQAAGAGGRYAMFKAGRIVSQDSQEIRDLLIEYIQKKGVIYPVVDQNWRLSVPMKLVIPERPR